MELGGGHRPPRHLAILRGAEVLCPLSGHRERLRSCLGCRYLQGTLEGPELPSILCAAPPRLATRRHRHGPRLIFFQDWPDAD